MDILVALQFLRKRTYEEKKMVFTNVVAGYDYGP